jgi:hypothetical protein
MGPFQTTVPAPAISSRRVPGSGADVADPVVRAHLVTGHDAGRASGTDLGRDDRIHRKKDPLPSALQQVGRQFDPVLLHQGGAGIEPQCAKEGVRHGAADEEPVHAREESPR